MSNYYKRTDGRNAAGTGRTITGVSVRRGDHENVVFIVDEPHADDIPISKEEYDATLAANIEHNKTAPLPEPYPPLLVPEPPLTDEETRRLRVLLDQ
jgi:hypothetical protein